MSAPLFLALPASAAALSGVFTCCDLTSHIVTAARAACILCRLICICAGFLDSPLMQQWSACCLSLAVNEPDFYIQIQLQSLWLSHDGTNLEPIAIQILNLGSLHCQCACKFGHHPMTSDLHRIKTPALQLYMPACNNLNLRSPHLTWTIHPVATPMFVNTG